MIHFSLTPDEYRELLRIAYLGEWMINAPHDADAQDEAASRAFQTLLQAGYGHERGVDRDPETDEYFLSAALTDRLYDEHISDYDDHVFWDELAERLALRDFAAAQGVGVETIDREEHLAQLRPLEERWRQEFERHGVERLDTGGA